MSNPNQILRKEATRDRLGVGKTHFDEAFVLHDPADPWVPNTNNTVPRLRAVPLGIRAIGFFSDEIDTVAKALRRLRDQLTPEDLAARRRTLKGTSVAAKRAAARKAARPPRGALVRRPRSPQSAARR
jgi:hypothetical protein